MRDYENSIMEIIPYLRRYARALIENDHLADRVVQQCIDCAADLRQLVREDQKNSSQKIWLFSIFHNIYAEFLNEQNTIVAWLPSDMPDNPTAPGNLENDNYHRALTQLPLQQKQIFLLVSVERFLYEDVSKIVNMPLGAILSLLHTARNSIAEQIYAFSPSHATETVGATNNDPAMTADNNDEVVELSL